MPQYNSHVAAYYHQLGQSQVPCKEGANQVQSEHAYGKTVEFKDGRKFAILMAAQLHNHKKRQLVEMLRTRSGFTLGERVVEMTDKAIRKLKK